MKSPVARGVSMPSTERPERPAEKILNRFKCCAMHAWPKAKVAARRSGV